MASARLDYLLGVRLPTQEDEPKLSQIMLLSSAKISAAMVPGGIVLFLILDSAFDSDSGGNASPSQASWQTAPAPGALAARQVLNRG